MVSPQLLRRFPGFVRALERSVRSVAVISREKKYEKGAVIFTEGEDAADVYFITEGEVDLTFDLPQGKVLVDTLVPGDVMGWSSLVEPGVLTASAVARTECRLITVDGEDLKGLFERDTSLGFYLLLQIVQALSQRIRSCHIQMASTYQHNDTS